MTIKLDGHVAVVTGGGRGLGRSHALDLARRGAAVVVNDLLADGDEPDPATAVVDEIHTFGGRAASSHADISTVDGGASVVERALDEFGKVDIFVHNAGISGHGSFADVDLDYVNQTIGIGLLGAWYVGQPAWRSMLEHGWGRIVLTGSGATFGHPALGAYAASKAGVVSLARSLQLEADALGVDIRANVIMPVAATRMLRPERADRWKGRARPEAVSAVVSLLSSEQCPVRGEAVHAVGGHICRLVIGETAGWHGDPETLDAERVLEHVDDWNTLDGLWWPRSSDDSTSTIFDKVTTYLDGAERASR
jgi:NAD(P)-dependent dehydrogenase (short-subunit alcohol dehydrogenase family)